MYKKYILLAIILLSLSTAAQCAENTAGNEKSDVTFNYSDSYLQKLKEGRQTVVENEFMAYSTLVYTLGSASDDCSNPAITLGGWKYIVEGTVENDADLYDWIGVYLTPGKYRIDLSFDPADLDVYVYGECWGPDGSDLIELGVSGSTSSEQIDFTITSSKYYKIKISDYKSGYRNPINWKLYISPIPDVTLERPVDDAKIIGNTPYFDWISNDVDGDSLANTIYIGTQKDVWTHPLYKINRGTRTAYTRSTPLSEGTYYWGVSVYDGTFNSKSDVWSFRVDSVLRPDLSITSADITFEKVN